MPHFYYTKQEIGRLSWFEKLSFLFSELDRPEQFGLVLLAIAGFLSILAIFFVVFSSPDQDEYIMGRNVNKRRI